MAELYTGTSKVLGDWSELYASIPSNIRSVLRPKVGDEIKWVVHNDRRIEITIVKKEE